MLNATFRLKDSFVDKYRNKKPPFGFNGLGEFVYLRTYSRIKADGTNEVWYETCRRVVEGTYRIQEDHIKKNDLGWSETRAQKSAQEMYDLMFNMKFLPPGRGLWAMGSELTEERGLFAALNNCAFTSTEFIDKDIAEPFTFLMDASMLGIGVGFDTKGAGKLQINSPWCNMAWAGPNVYVIPDSREGWVESVRLLLQSYFTIGGEQVDFDYSEIRKAGLPIKGFGGTSSGPEPLKQLHEQIRSVLNKLVGKLITVEAIVDIMNLIGCCVVAGNVRRTAEIVFGDYEDETYLDLKNYHWVPTKKFPCSDCDEEFVIWGHYEGPRADRSAYGWTSNNSVFAKVGMNYYPVAQRTYVNGEPGYEWLENARAYGRMMDPPNFKDKKVVGANPCVEQSLEHMELCCLVETFPNNCTDLAEYKRVLKYAYLYAKTVTLGKTPWPKTNKVLLRNRRIGTSMSGIQQFVVNRGLNELRGWCLVGYDYIQAIDKTYSDWFAIPLSIKTTSIKPSGTVSLVVGATPGMHWPEGRWQIRRVRVGNTSVYVLRFQEANYTVEPDQNDPDHTMVIDFPVDMGEGLRSVSEVSMWEQFEMAAFLQRYWADNQVSSTVTFDPKKVTSHEIAACLDYYQYQLKGISLLPQLEEGAFAQMPYEQITEEEYIRLSSRLLPVNLSGLSEEATPETGCSNDTCIVKFEMTNEQ